MLRKAIGLLLLGATLISAHGKISLARGNAGGNGTALGIQGGIVPGMGINNVTEVDTTVFRGASAAGCGYTKGGGVNQVVSGIQQVMALSGKTLPQVTAGGYLYGILHVVVSDGWGPYTAHLDTTGLGVFTHQVNMTILNQIPGENGVLQPGMRRAARRMLEKYGLVKRTFNIDQDFPFRIAMPSGVTCNGAVAGLQNICIVKFLNDAGAGPFGGCIPIQQVAAVGAGIVSVDPLSTSSRTTAYVTPSTKPTNTNTKKTTGTMTGTMTTATGTAAAASVTSSRSTGTATAAASATTSASGAVANTQSSRSVFALAMAVIVAVVGPALLA